ncbi:MAG: FliH/SctL family protein [Deltaproteobacteria bacterium]|nr:FliH/SctL family protein [Deltaproteobacteria bacterium]
MAAHSEQPELDDISSPQAFVPRNFDQEGKSGSPGGPPATRGGDFASMALPGQAELGTFQAADLPGLDPNKRYAAMRWERENTLLTNAEGYAASIREEAELYVQQLRQEAEALNQQADKRYAEAEQTQKQSLVDAERLKADTEAQMAALREQGRQEGYEIGRDEGLREAYKDAQPSLERMQAILEELEAHRTQVAYQAEKDGVRLALIMAKKILLAELKINKQAVLKLLASTLRELEDKGVFRVYLNPEDHRFAQAAKPALERFLKEGQRLSLLARPNMTPGSVMVETDREVIDLTIQSQFYHLEQQLNQALLERETVRVKQPAQAREKQQLGKSPANSNAPTRSGS